MEGNDEFKDNNTTSSQVNSQLKIMDVIQKQLEGVSSQLNQLRLELMTGTIHIPNSSSDSNSDSPASLLPNSSSSSSTSESSSRIFPEEISK